MRRLSVICLLAALGLVPGASRALPVGVLSAIAYTYVPGGDAEPNAPLVLDEGGRLFFANADVLGYHSVLSRDSDANGEPLFSAPLVAAGEATEVRGVSALGPGLYRFMCDVHGPVMEGTLRIAE